MPCLAAGEALQLGDGLALAEKVNLFAHLLLLNGRIPFPPVMIINTIVIIVARVSGVMLMSHRVRVKSVHLGLALIDCNVARSTFDLSEKH